MRCEIEEEKRKQEQERVMQERQNHQMVKGDIPPKVEMKNNSEMVDSKKGTECLQSSSLVISAENFSVSSTSSCSDSASSKDEKSVIKELEGQVSDLQMQVLSLSQNLEDSNRENSRLKKALDNIRELVKFKFGYEIGDELFDFSPVKSQCAAESDMSNSDNNDAIKRNFTGFEQDLRGQDGAVTDISTDLEGDLDKDIPLPPLETPQFTYEDENSKNATSEQTLLFCQ